MFESFFYYIGIYSFVIFLCWILQSPFMILMSYLKEILLPMTKKSLVTKYGNWAVITGATDGIGKAYAKEMAYKQFNIVLISRSEDKLKKVKEEIENEAGVEVKYIIADFSHGFEIYDRIEKELADIPVGVLVNNVGYAPEPTNFEGHSNKIIWDMILINCTCALLMTKIVLPGMKNRSKGAIVNVSSICVLSPLINSASVYYATKVFLSSFTRTLQWELLGHRNIHIQLVEPAFVNTKMLDFSTDVKEMYITADSKEWCKSAISLLGRSHYTHAYYKHSILAFLLSMLPENIRVLIVYFQGKYLGV